MKDEEDNEERNEANEREEKGNISILHDLYVNGHLILLSLLNKEI